MIIDTCIMYRVQTIVCTLYIIHVPIIITESHWNANLIHVDLYYYMAPAKAPKLDWLKNPCCTILKTWSVKWSSDNHAIYLYNLNLVFPLASSELRCCKLPTQHLINTHAYLFFFTAVLIYGEYYYLTISGFTSLNGLICLHSVLDKAGSQSVFKRT